MGVSWQAEARFRAEIQELRQQLQEMESVRTAAEEVVRARGAALALSGLEARLRSIRSDGESALRHTGAVNHLDEPYGTGTFSASDH
jgi:hypothetical protein